MLDKISLYKYNNDNPEIYKLNPSFDLYIYNEVDFYRYTLMEDNEYMKEETIYYNNLVDDSCITHNYGYSVGAIRVNIYYSPTWPKNTFNLMHDSVDDDHTWRILNIPIELYDEIKKELLLFLHAPANYLKMNVEFIGRVPIYSDAEIFYCLFDKFGDVIVTKYNLLGKVVIDY